jgi:pimeloyl-ACP methyl ester carboxylesterase
MSPIPFKVQWDEPVVAHVLARVASYPFPQAPDGGGWSYGCDADYLKALCAHWIEGFDWRGAEADLNRYPQFVVPIRTLEGVEDFDLHFVHVVGEAGGKRPLLITHGWPGSHYEFWDVIDKLAFPSKHGGTAADALDLVIPSLPGFGFSSKPKKPVGQRTTARLFDRLMSEVLGYDRYLAQGGDWGGLVTGWLGLDHAEHVKAIHLTMMGLRSAGPPQGEEELAWAQQGQAASQTLGAYFQLQASKPQSLAWAMADNPVGQAAWIVERFHDWSDLRTRPFEAVYAMDQLLTNIMIYVMTGSFTTSVWYYRALFEEGGAALAQGQRVETPTAFANFPGEALYKSPPRSFAERSYNVTRWTDMPRGGHFAAMEAPDLYVEDVRAWARAVG